MNFGYRYRYRYRYGSSAGYRYRYRYQGIGGTLPIAIHLDGFRPPVACIIIQMVIIILRRMRRMSLQMDLYMFTMTDDRQLWIWNNPGQIITYLHSSVLTVAVFSFNSTPYCKIVNIAVEIWQSSALWICHRRRLPDFFRKTSGNMRNSSAHLYCRIHFFHNVKILFPV